ncbi:MAG: IS1380 family transposase, partial [bacterium]|nr:IS1380 family transposase [bacterium]
GHDRLPHPSTMGGWLRPMDDPSRGASGHGLDRFRTLLNQRLLSQERRLDYTWDVDATHDPSHNKTALYSDHKEKGYYPMLRIPYETPLSLR